MSDYYTYVFVRTDLPFEQQIIQVGHACHEAASYVTLSPHPVQLPLPTPNIVLFQVSTEAELITTCRDILKQRVFIEPFLEEDHDRGFTAAASQPIHRDHDKRLVFADYKKYEFTAPLPVPLEAP